MAAIRVSQPPVTSSAASSGNWRANISNRSLVLESWSEGFLVGALVIMACITVANMRRKVLLHKLILLELLLAMSHGTFCFMTFKGFGWYLSATAMLLYNSWWIHNLVAWIKIKPFIRGHGEIFRPTVGIWIERIYLGTLLATLGPILTQIVGNFLYFNGEEGTTRLYRRLRPYEPFFRDPWWIFSCLLLFHVVRNTYGTSPWRLMRRSPRFAILLSAIALSLIFTILDIVTSIDNFVSKTTGINPWWKLSLVFKDLTDTIVLDDFKTELNRLGLTRMKQDPSPTIHNGSEPKSNELGSFNQFEFADATKPIPPPPRTGPPKPNIRARPREPSLDSSVEDFETEQISSDLISTPGGSKEGNGSPV